MVWLGNTTWLFNYFCYSANYICHITLEAYLLFDSEGIMECNLLYSKFLANCLYFLITRFPALSWIIWGIWRRCLDDLLRYHRNGECKTRDEVIFDLRSWWKEDSEKNSFLKEGRVAMIDGTVGTTFGASLISWFSEYEGLVTAWNIVRACDASPIDSWKI